jgi:hypothetical protein
MHLIQSISLMLAQLLPAVRAAPLSSNLPAVSCALVYAQCRISFAQSPYSRKHSCLQSGRHLNSTSLLDMETLLPTVSAASHSTKSPYSWQHSYLQSAPHLIRRISLQLAALMPAVSAASHSTSLPTVGSTHACSQRGISFDQSPYSWQHSCPQSATHLIRPISLQLAALVPEVRVASNSTDLLDMAKLFPTASAAISLQSASSVSQFTRPSLYNDWGIQRQGVGGNRTVRSFCVLCQE